MCEFEENLLTKPEYEKAKREYAREGKAVYILEVPNILRDRLHVPQCSPDNFIMRMLKGSTSINFFF